MKYLSLILILVFISCENKKDILLPKSNSSIVKDIQDHSPIYIFFETKGKDTIAEVNRKNSIISTNWILNIDKRLPLRLVIPEVMKLQQKKREEKAHKNEAAQNYYSYADTIGKNMAFIPFTEVYYKMAKPKSGTVVFFNKNNEIWVNNVAVKKEELANYLNTFGIDKQSKTTLCFDKNMKYGSYIQNKIFIRSLNFSKSELTPIIFNQEFVY
ncbi:hypothetical protein [Flavobacterium sp. 123]|uniref:hypothetical protein n=1 Tax=Flavobacterium sp. 123 TaxID=2135627 RepID=UPI000EAEEC56|nr:hypothetical protein [Flavobacterium sp. 123]RKT00552.1 hypothetical protein C8C88_2381 [Flavobacterium sp. 123]